jgi:hypothetical protein
VFSGGCRHSGFLSSVEMCLLLQMFANHALALLLFQSGQQCLCHLAGLE